MKDEIIKNINLIHTTKMGVDRIRKNLELDNGIDVVKYCTEKIHDDKSIVKKYGKNYYVEIDNIIITVNSYSFTIITANRK